MTNEIKKIEKVLKLQINGVYTSRGGGAVPHQAHNLKAPVQFRLPQQIFYFVFV